MAGNYPNLKNEIFDSFQENLIFSHPQQKHLEQLVKWLEQDPDQFLSLFKDILSQFIKNFKKSEKCQKGINILVSFFKEIIHITCRYESERKNKIVRNFAIDIVETLVTLSETSSILIREPAIWLLEKLITMNICQLLNLPDSLKSKLQNMVSVLLKDSKAVRKLAIRIAIGLETIDHYIHILIDDGDTENRKVSIQATQDQDKIKIISQGLYDIESSVRIVTMNKLLEWGIKDLTLEDKRTCFFSCVTERNQHIQQLAIKIIKNEFLKSGIVELIQSLEIDSLAPINQKNLNESFKVLMEESESTSLINVCEGILQKFLKLEGDCAEWFVLTQGFKFLRKKDEKLVDQIMKNAGIIELIGVIHAREPYLFTQVCISLATCMDYKNEEVRMALIEKLLNVCKNFPLLIKQKDFQYRYEISVYAKVFAFDSVGLLKFVSSRIKKLSEFNENEFIRIMSELINDIKEPISLRSEENDSKFVKNTQSGLTLIQKHSFLKSKLEDIEMVIDELENNFNEFIAQDKVKVAYKLQREIDAKIRDREKFTEELDECRGVIEEVLVVSIILTNEMMIRSKHGNLHIDIQNIIDTLIDPAMQSDNEFLIEVSIECLGQCCFNSTEFLKIKKDLFLDILNSPNCCDSAKFIPLVILCDLLLLKDPTNLQKILINEESKSKATILWEICRFAFSSSTYLRAYSIEGIIKILLVLKSKSSSILSILMISYFDSTTPDLIKQSLHVFFPHFSMLGKTNSNILCKAFKTFIFFLFCLSSNQESIDIKYNFNVKKIFLMITTCLSSAYTEKHGEFELTKNYNLEIFYHICQTSIKILTSENKSEFRIQLKPEVLIRFLPYINISQFNDKELFLCLSMMKKINIPETYSEYSILAKMIQKIEKKKIGYLIIDDLDNNLIDSFIKSEVSAGKFFGKLDSDSSEVREALLHIKNVFNVYKALKKSPSSRLCSELKRSKNI